MLLVTPHADAQWPSLRLFGGGDQSEQTPGTPEWWEKHRGEAVLEPGQGYRVPGVEGFFDGDGRPMQAPVDEVAASLRQKEEAGKGILPGLDPKRGYQRVRDAIGAGPDQQAAQALFDQGRELYTQQQYGRAAAVFESAAERFPGSRLAEQSRFFAAESYFYDNQYVKARDSYNQLVSDFPSTRRLDRIVEVQWQIAKYWEKYHFEYDENPSLQPNFFDKKRPTFDTIGAAVATYDSIRLNDPTGPRADDAVMATAGIFFRQGRFIDADYHYTLLREDYPRSELQFEAHLLGLQSKLQMYQGPDYDGRPLEDAKRLAKQIRNNFGGRLTAEEKDRLSKVDAQLQRSLEERELRRAQYYDNIQQYAAARQIYAEIASKYNGSPVAQQSAARLAQLGGLPDTPEKPLGNFVALFPQNRERAKFSNIPEVQAQATRLAANPSANNTGVTPASATQPTNTTQTR